MWAEPDTMLGMMQRGRGACRGLALEQPALAREFVIGCIVRDPRWDHQIEQRAWLYAALVVELGVDLSMLRAAYSGPMDPSGDSDAWILTGILELLARRGVDGAVGELRNYLRSGRDLDQALDALIPYVDHPEAEGLLADVLQIADDEQLRSLLAPYGSFRDVSAPPWPEWRRASDRIERVLASVERTRPPVPTRARHDRSALAAADRERVLRAAVESGLISSPPEPSLTMTDWETTLLEVAPRLLRAVKVPLRTQIAVSRSLNALRSPPALAWARANADLDDVVGSTAISLLAGLAEPSDGPRLLEYLTETTAGGTDRIGVQCRLVVFAHRSRRYE